MGKKVVAEIVAEVLEAAGKRYVFGYPGGRRSPDTVSSPHRDTAA